MVVIGNIIYEYIELKELKKWNIMNGMVEVTE